MTTTQRLVLDYSYRMVGAGAYRVDAGNNDCSNHLLGAGSSADQVYATDGIELAGTMTSYVEALVFYRKFYAQKQRQIRKYTHHS